LKIITLLVSIFDKEENNLTYMPIITSQQYKYILKTCPCLSEKVKIIDENQEETICL
jgi:hypothetical protein